MQLTEQETRLRPLAQQIWHRMDELCRNAGLKRPWGQLHDGVAGFLIQHQKINEKLEHPSAVVIFTEPEIKNAIDLDSLIVSRFENAKTSIINLMSKEYEN